MTTKDRGSNLARVHGSNADFVFRVYEDGGKLNFTGSTTATFRRPFDILLRDCSALAEAVNSLRRTKDYHEGYISILHGRPDEEEFEVQVDALDEEFAVEEQHLSVGDVARRAESLMRWVPTWDLTVSELTGILRVDPDLVEAAAPLIDKFSRENCSTLGVGTWLDNLNQTQPKTAISQSHSLWRVKSSS